MLNSTTTDLVHRLMEIERISEAYASKYDDIIDKISIAEFSKSAFKHTVSISSEDFYIHIKQTNEETALIEKYAVGIEQGKNNILRFDNAKDHHDGLTYDPHHKHILDKDRVFDFDGTIDTMIKELNEYFKR